ncbi:DNA polymerase III sliding clamp [Mycobacterium phage SoSeph]|nr:hypothetical protein SEA_WATERFOUL_48 [Mycobacterium phage Waterfoul]QXN73790.1 DNA polymerase III sliding clamp [Mycobacterium phage SoSeph]WNM65517.1 DNA polymerase III sliding clamp beta [Mycobacterium phage Heftyboy]
MLTINTADLTTGLAFIKRATGYSASRARSRMPVLNTVRLSAHNGGLIVETFDFETAVTLRLPGAGMLAQTVVSIDDLHAALKTIGRRQASITATTSALSIESSGVSVHSPAFAALDDLPAMPDASGQLIVPPRPCLHMTGAEFAATTAAVSAAIGTDDTLPMLTGVRLDVEPAEASAVAATDRFKLAVVDVKPADGFTDTVAALLPGRPVVSFGKFAAKSDTVTVTVAGQWVVLASNTAKVQARLMDAEFPQYRHLLPGGDPAVEFTIDPHAWAKLLKPASAATRSMRFHISAGGVVAFSHPEDGVRLDMETTDMRAGEPLVIGLAPEYLAALLATAPRGVKATVAVRKPNRPIIVSWPGARMLLMPVRIPGDDGK